MTKRLLVASPRLIILLVSGCIACSCVRGVTASEDRARRIVAKSLDARSSIQSLHLKLSVVRIEDRRNNEIAGSTCFYETWQDFAAGSLRSDLTTEAPNKAALDGRVSVVFKDGVCRVFPGMHVRGSEYHNKPANFLRDGSSGTRLMMSLDPRLLGCVPSPFHSLHGYTLSEYQTLLDRCSATLGDEKSNSIEVSHFENPEVEGHRLSFWIDSSTLRIKKTQLQVDNDAGRYVAMVDNNWTTETETGLPNRVTVSVRRNGVIELKETSLILSSELNPELDDDIFQWSGMGLPDNYIIKDMSAPMRPYKQWDSSTEKFGRWKPQPDEKTRLSVSGAGTMPRKLLLLLGCMGLLILGCSLMVLGNAKKKSEQV